MNFNSSYKRLPRV